MTDSDTTQDCIERPPANLAEAAVANCRPQPAIPAVLVMLLFVMLPMISGVAAAGGWAALLIAAGIMASCGLAIAAGFCSFFPPLVWIALGLWCYSLPAFANLPGYNSALLILGVICATAMLGIQAWRVLTGRFTPTIREHPNAVD